jgi:hypothetical protein
MNVPYATVAMTGLNATRPGFSGVSTGTLCPETSLRTRRRPSSLVPMLLGAPRIVGMHGQAQGETSKPWLLLGHPDGEARWMLLEAEP